MAEAAKGWETLLEEGEHILWQGAPSDDFRLDRKDTALKLFCIVAFAVFLSIANIGISILVIILLPLFVVGQLLPSLRDMGLRRSTYYTLTNRRAFIAKEATGAGRRLKFWHIGPATPLELVDGNPGSVVFGISETSIWGKGNTRGNSWRVAPAERPQFYMIDDARHVFDLMQQIQAGAQQQRHSTAGLNVANG